MSIIKNNVDTIKTKTKQNQKITSLGEHGEKLETLYPVDRNIKWWSSYKKQYGVSSEN